jgi:hypothetical protein
MTQNAKFRAEAPTLEDLIDLLREASEMLGEDAKWIGFNDGSIHVWAGGDGPILYIEPETTLLHKRDAAGRAK